MIEFNFEEQTINDATRGIISAMLPHENYRSSYFSECAEVLRKAFNPLELPVPFRILTNICDSFYRIKLSVTEDEGGSELKIERNVIEDYMNASLLDYIKSNLKDVQDWIQDEVDVPSLATAQGLHQATSAVGSAVLDLYDECLEMAKDSSQISILKSILLEAIKDNASRSYVIAIKEIMTTGHKSGRRMYHGADDMREFSLRFFAELKDKVSSAESKIVSFDNLEIFEKMDKENEASSEVLGEYGVLNMDDLTPLLPHRLDVLVGEPNIGKTSFAIQIANSVTSKGFKCAYVSGESTSSKIRDKYQSNYIYRNLGGYVNSRAIGKLDPVCEETQRFINISNLKIAKEGRFFTLPAITYEHTYEDLKNIYEQTGARVIIIDHTLSMRHDRSAQSYGTSRKDSYDDFCYDLRDFKNDYPVCIIILSHPSNDAIADLKRFGRIQSDTNSTKYTSIFRGEADNILFMYKSDAMRANDTIGIGVQKRRDATPPTVDTVLKVGYDTNSFEYDPELQPVSNDQISKEKALESLDANYDSAFLESGSTGFSASSMIYDE